MSTPPTHPAATPAPPVSTATPLPTLTGGAFPAGGGGCGRRGFLGKIWAAPLVLASALAARPRNAPGQEYNKDVLLPEHWLAAERARLDAGKIFDSKTATELAAALRKFAFDLPFHFPHPPVYVSFPKIMFDTFATHHGNGKSLRFFEYIQQAPLFSDTEKADVQRDVVRLITNLLRMGKKHVGASLMEGTGKGVHRDIADALANLRGGIEEKKNALIVENLLEMLCLCEPPEANRHAKETILQNSITQGTRLHQGKFNNCGYVAEINAIANTHNGASLLNKICRPSTGGVKVKFKDGFEQFIPRNDLKNLNFAGFGNLNLRAVLLAEILRNVHEGKELYDGTRTLLAQFTNAQNPLFIGKVGVYYDSTLPKINAQVHAKLPDILDNFKDNTVLILGFAEKSKKRYGIKTGHVYSIALDKSKKSYLLIDPLGTKEILFSKNSFTDLTYICLYHATL